MTNPTPEHTPDAGTSRRVPPSLLLAAGVVALQGFFLLAYAVRQLFQVAEGDLASSIAEVVFLGIFSAGLLLCAHGLRSRRSWARGPSVLAQLIQLGVAWSLRSGDTVVAAVVLALLAAAALVGLLHPASTAALERRGYDEEETE